MRSPLVILALAVALAAPGAPGTAHGGPAATDTAEVRRWSEDFDFLAREMPARHANLFHTVRRESFDSSLAAIRSRLPSLERHEVIVELMRLAASVGDGHTNVSPWRDTAIAFHRLPVALHRFGDGYHVRAATREHAGLLGAKVLRIGDVAIDSAEALVAPLVGRDNAMGVWTYAPLLLQMPEVLHAVGLSRDAGGADLVLEAGGSRRTVHLREAGRFPNLSGDVDRSWDVPEGWVDLRERSAAPRWLSATRESRWFTVVPEGRLLYCQLNEVMERGESMQDFFARALAAADSARAGRFVLDLRLNGGGNGDFNRAIVRALVRSRFDERGRLYVVTGRRTFSAAQMLACDLEAWSHPVFVGEPSASRGNHYGDSRRLVLPHHRVTVRVSTLWWQHWDPRDSRPWIAPEVAAPLTLADYAAGRDPALEAIARHVPQPSFFERIRPLLLAGDRAAAWRLVEAYRADPVNAWQDAPRRLRHAQQQLEYEGRREAAALAGELRERLATATARAR